MEKSNVLKTQTRDIFHDRPIFTRKISDITLEIV